ncbi:MAG TPA: cytidine deaminase [Bacteroidales bacterium]|nr:cytidine deaminase [Bacteroidales bacterium]
MKTRNISVYYTEYDNIEELTPEDRELIIAAREVSENAYAPYSKFRVGAAVRLSGGNIVKGANVENAAYPSGICAERNALANCVTNFPGETPLTIAIAAFNHDGKADENVSPCGMCRQVIAEEESRNGNKIRMILSGAGRIVIIDSVSDLLPLQFNMNNLRVAHP